ncbi:phosphorothioated DNA-binding restriction endonuclease [Halalkalibacter nanhaiisediminis]|uniref:Putative restriction endonuclease n=1 Tax=Halalkalibacter nanhaiisediminis TaxID=688079 RepID=A0A562QN56_9BACI|nr:HNH endonuclease [Halalkalibacter nanhaiisediminis]TWI58188.1 putative restriction endonuclease [Halalkalibacter nanhaiisediminis]
MNSEELLNKIKHLSIWKKGDQRAPHKPLLILFALGQLQVNNQQSLSYEETREPLKQLLIEFGPQRSSYHPEQPFVRLTSDGLWQLNKEVDKRKFTDRFLLHHEVVGGFKEEVYLLLTGDNKLVQNIAESLLREHFPETIHEDILRAVGLDFETSKRRQRDAKFREKILQAYEYSCAVCGFNVRLGHNLVGIEAAHIKWHQAGGPDTEENGIALCSMHHKLFDRGVFTFSESRELLVATQAHGTHGFDEWLMRYHGKQLRSPIHPLYQPQERFIHWHTREVFRGPARYQVN